MPTKFMDIISKSVLIHSGSPVVYQLKAKQEICGTVKRKSIGEKDVNKINKTILLVGEIGAGKSTLINTLLNYMMGVKFEDNVWFEIVENEKPKSCWESQTYDVIMYELFGFQDQPLPYSLTIIDTPGYGDTSKRERDVISQGLLQWFDLNNGVHELHAVGLVMKASDNRLSDRLMYVFNSVASLFGEDLEKNIVALITHSDGRKPKNVFQALEAAKIKCARNEKNEPVHFLFNNCQKEDRAEDSDYLEHASKISERGLRQFEKYLDKTVPQTMKTTVNVLDEHKCLAACVHNLQDRIRVNELKRREVEQIQEALNKHEEEMEMNKDFTIEVEEVYTEKVPISPVGGMWSCCFSHKTTSCTVCQRSCHPICKIALTPRFCTVMTRGKCTLCKCPASDHVRENWTYVTKSRKVQKTLDDVREKYEQNKTEYEGKLSILTNVEKEINKLTEEKNSLLEELYKHVVGLEQIALNVDSLSTHVHLDFLIEKMKERGDTVKVQKLEEIRSRQDEGIRAAQRYFSCGNKQQQQQQLLKQNTSHDVAEHQPSDTVCMDV